LGLRKARLGILAGQLGLHGGQDAGCLATTSRLHGRLHTQIKIQLELEQGPTCLDLRLCLPVGNGRFSSWRGYAGQLLQEIVGQYLLDLLQTVSHVVLCVGEVTWLGATYTQRGEEGVQLLQRLQLLEVQHEMSIAGTLQNLE